MTWNQPDEAPSSDSPQRLHALATDLRAVDYTVDGVAQLLGPSANAALGRDQPVPALLRASELLHEDATSPAAALAVVVQLWLLGQSVSRDELTTALPGTGVDGAAALGLVQPDGELWRAAVGLRPYGIEDAADLWVASDLGARQRHGVLRRDHVLGIGQASLSLAQLTIRADVDRALDLGTGCGIRIFHFLRHARRVVATDVSVRALAFARFNLLLNADALELDPLRLESRVELRCGRLLEPVAGERFELVVSNPPFVITSSRLWRFEELTSAIKQPLAPHLGAAVRRHDWLGAGGDEQLLTERLTVAADVTEERHQRPGAEHPGVILLHQGGRAAAKNTAQH